ncbi:hypothetical protein F5Y04DRAFT_258706 [Hypomontagnella monticulosa]|nr:hypothetical protein F5Y04DRAFT_258706 [Hypomontagnella monticulosa]
MSSDFPGMNDGNAQEHRPRGPRLYHKKSRTGCMRCKQRRVKCDENRPSCGSCTRHAVPCVYSTAGTIPSGVGRATSATQHNGGPSIYQTTTSSPPSVSGSVANVLGPHSNENRSAYSPQTPGSYPSPSSSHLTPMDDGGDGDINLPENSWRRFWELRLLNNYHIHMVQPFPVAQAPEVVLLWQQDISELSMRMAQQHNRCSLLHVTFANSALNLWTKSTDKREREELMKLLQWYQISCSKEQRRDIDELHQNLTENADYVCFTSIMILAHSLALVQTLVVDPWEPPVLWLHMGRGAGEVLNMARQLVNPETKPKIGLFAKGPPDMSNAAELINCDHSSLDWLLEHPAGPGSIAAQEDRELDDENVRRVYGNALSYTCSVQSAIDRGEPDFAIVRRLGGFAVWVPTEFTRFIEERRPRAMVVLANFMAIWLDYSHIWMIGRAGELQIRGIYKVLPIDWSSKLDGFFAKLNSRKQ